MAPSALQAVHAGVAGPPASADCGPSHWRATGSHAATAPGRSESGNEDDYTDGYGDQFFQRQPPKGFSPLNATDAELAFYGFPAKPTDPDSLATWQEAMQAWHGFIAGPPACAPPMGTANTLANQWSGEQVRAQTDTHLTEINGKITVPHTVFTCPHSSDVALWFGLSELLQAGVLDNGGTANNWFFWYEATDGTRISQGPGDTDIVPVPGTVNPGDNVYVNVYYDTTAGQVTFYWEDLTNSSTYSFTAGSLASYPASHYWSIYPYLADAIGERTTDDSGYIRDLRQWDSGSAAFRAATVWKQSGTSGLMETYNTVDYDMKANASPSGDAIAHWEDVTGAGAFNVAHDNYCE